MSAIAELEELLRANGQLSEGQSFPSAGGDAGGSAEGRIASNVGVYARNGAILGLAARYCGVTALPESIGRLTDLRQLDLSGNLLTALPESLGELAHLKKLYLDQNQLASLPGSLGRLTGLVELHLDYNHLTELPPGVGQLASLETLNLHNNRLRSVPDELGQLSSCLLYTSPSPRD